MPARLDQSLSESANVHLYGSTGGHRVLLLVDDERRTIQVRNIDTGADLVTVGFGSAMQAAERLDIVLVDTIEVQLDPGQDPAVRALLEALTPLIAAPPAATPQTLHPTTSEHAAVTSTQRELPPPERAAQVHVPSYPAATNPTTNKKIAIVVIGNFAVLLGSRMSLLDVFRERVVVDPQATRTLQNVAIGLVIVSLLTAVLGKKGGYICGALASAGGAIASFAMVNYLNSIIKEQDATSYAAVGNGLYICLAGFVAAFAGHILLIIESNAAGIAGSFKVPPQFHTPPRTTQAPPSSATSGPATDGWYPDPFGRSRVRYFDGSAWTDHVV